MSQKQVKFTPHTFSHDGAALTWWQGGRGQPTVWLHGWAHSHEDMEGLARNCPGQHFLVDLPGFGDSPLPDPSWQTTQVVDFLAAWMQSLDVGPVRLVGHSWGGRLAVDWAGRYPEQVARLVLLSAGGFRRPVSWRTRLRSRLLPWLARDRDTRRWARYFRQMTKGNVKIAAHIQAPTLIIYGKKDRITPPHFAGQYSALIPNAHAKILPHVNHWTILQAKPAILGELQPFLAPKNSQ